MAIPVLIKSCTHMLGREGEGVQEGQNESIRKRYCEVQQSLHAL